MLRSDQVSTEVDEIGDGSVGSQESLGLLERFELSHASFPHPSRLMGLLSPIVRIPRSIVDYLRH